MLYMLSYVLYGGKLKSVARIEEIPQTLILHHFLIFHVTCYLFGSYKNIIDKIFFEEVRRKFHNDMFLCTAYAERRNKCR